MPLLQDDELCLQVASSSIFMFPLVYTVLFCRGSLQILLVYKWCTCTQDDHDEDSEGDEDDEDDDDELEDDDDDEGMSEASSEGFSDEGSEDAEVRS